jgi:hypothetical protein
LTERHILTVGPRFAERHLDDEIAKLNENEANLFTYSPSSTGSSTGQPDPGDPVPSQYSSAIHMTAEKQQRAREPLEADNLSKSHTQSPPNCYFPAESPVPAHDDGNNLRHLPDMQNWIKPSPTRETSGRRRFHGADPISTVVEHLLEGEPTPTKMRSMGTHAGVTRVPVCGNRSRQITSQQIQTPDLHSGHNRDKAGSEPLHDHQQSTSTGVANNARRYYPSNQIPQVGYVLFKRNT